MGAQVYAMPVQSAARTDAEIELRMLATALYNYHRVMTGRATIADHKTWFDLTVEQQAFLVDFAVPMAMQTIWRGR